MNEQQSLGRASSKLNKNKGESCLSTIALPFFSETLRPLTPLACIHQPACPACPRFGKFDLPLEQVEQLQSLVAPQDNIRVESLAGQASGYRTRARLSYRAYEGKGRFGVFEAGSHRLVPIPSCSLHHPLINDLVNRVETLSADANISAYNEVSRGGLLRGAQLMVSPLSKKAQLTLVINRDLAERPLGARLQKIVDSLRELPEIESLWLSEHLTQSNVFLGQRHFLQFGPQFLELSLGGFSSFYPPDSFTQANLELHEESLQRIITAVEEKGSNTEIRVGEFYAGAGSIGIPLIAKGYELFMNEISPGSLAGLERGLHELRSHESIAEPQIFLGDAQEFIEQLAGLDVLIVDPPRKGLGKRLLQAISTSSISRLIYLSCGLPSLLREAEELRESGFRAIRLSALGYFPYTKHIESLVVFERSAQIDLAPPYDDLPGSV